MIAANLDPITRQVIMEMPDQDDQEVRYVRTLAADIGLPVEQLRHILRQLGEQGLATYGTRFRENDRMPMGSSWWLTKSGTALRDQLLGDAS